VLSALRSMWWATLVIGIVAVILGLIAIFLPVAALTAIVVLAGLFALLTGILGIIGGIRGVAHDSGGWLELLWGLLGAGIGLFVLFEPRTGAVVLFLLFGIWALLRGGLEVLAAVRLRRVMRGWVAMLVVGLLWVALGVLFLIAPGASAIATTIVWGIIVVVIGVSTIVAVGFAHRAIRDLENEESAVSTMTQF
jgi:uncharacterized membrane protein HdeD (DUF308 family)